MFAVTEGVTNGEVNIVVTDLDDADNDVKDPIFDSSEEKKIDTGIYVTDENILVVSRDVVVDTVVDLLVVFDDD